MTPAPAPEGTRTVHLVLPGDVGDPATPSGGNTYDLRLRDGLAATGWSVSTVLAHGGWPRPGPGDQAALDHALAAVPDGACVLLDALVGCSAPDVVTAHLPRLRAVALVHLPLADETGLSPADAAGLDAGERRVLRSCAAVVATGSTVAHRLTEHHGVPAQRVHLAHPGVDPAPATAASDGGTRLLCVASLTPRKGHDVLVEALARIADLPWTCACAGAVHRSRDFVDRVERLVERHRLGGRVRLLGPRTGDDLAALYAKADLLVLASRAEPYGMVVTEALARGIPAVVCEVDGLPEALGRARDGQLPGLLVPPGDPGALAAALRAWLTDPELRGRCRAAAADRRTVLPTWATTAAAVAAVLEGSRRTG